MYYFIIVILLGIYSVKSLIAQTFPYKWEKVHISSDSMLPQWIHFIDSVNGYFLGCVKKESPDMVFNPKSLEKYLLFKTSDGGKNWIKISNQIYQELYYRENGFISAWRKQPMPPYAFPTNKDHYIVMPSYDSTITLWNDSTLPIKSNWIYRTHNGGQTWLLDRQNKWFGGENDDVIDSFQFLTALGAKDLIFFGYNDERSNKLFRSYDGGMSMGTLASDEVFSRTVHPDTIGAFKNLSSTFQLAVSDPLHWTALIYRPGIDNNDDTASFYKLFPRGLHTLVTNNMGKTWQAFNTILGVDIENAMNGALQYIKNSPDLYYFSNIASHAEGFFLGDVARPAYGINFCYSSDYGMTWKIDTTFGQRRRAFEAVQKDKLWFTLPRNETGRDDDPAYILTRTTDGGMTYEFDTTTLTHFEQKLDGRIITFSDPRHGWIVATGDNHKDLYILRYDANEQPKSVEEDIYKGYYGLHYTLYPNPARETATLDLYKYFMMEDLKAYNILGAEVPLRYHIEGSKVELDVRDLPIGHYTLRVKHNWGVSIIPLVVMR